MSKSWASTLSRVGEMVGGVVSPLSDAVLGGVNNILDEVSDMQKLYVLKNENGDYKIGVSKNPKTRARGISNSSGIKVWVLAEYEPKSVDARELERRLHYSFNDNRGIGEWFKFPQEESIILEKIANATKTLDSTGVVVSKTNKVNFKPKSEKKFMINLSKAQVVVTGERVNLSKAVGAHFTKPVVGLEWNTKAGITVDCDLSIVLLDAEDNVISGSISAGKPSCLAFYGNQDLPGVHLYEDNQTGDDTETDTPSGCDEQADIDFEKLDGRVSQVVIVATTHSEAPNSTPENPIKDKPVPFGRAAKPRVVIFNVEAGQYEPKITYELDEENGTATAVEVAKFYRRNGDWVYTSMGDEKGTDAFGLQAMLDTYKITG